MRRRVTRHSIPNPRIREVDGIELLRASTILEEFDD